MYKKTFSRNSWHYKLVTHFGNMSQADPIKNICDYRLAVFASLMVFTLAIGAIVTLSSVLIMPIAWSIVNYFELGYWPIKDDAVVTAGFILWGMIVLGVIVFVIRQIILLIAKKYFAPKITAPGFIKTAYRSFRDKYCIEIDFK